MHADTDADAGLGQELELDVTRYEVAAGDIFAVVRVSLTGSRGESRAYG